MVPLYVAKDSGQWTKDAGGNLYHAIASTAMASVAGSTTIELMYADNLKAEG
jgi:hypothetical protein